MAFSNEQTLRHGYQTKMTGPWTVALFHTS